MLKWQSANPIASNPVMESKWNTSRIHFNGPQIQVDEESLKAPFLYELEQLIKKVAPIVCFHPDETCFPTAVENYLQKTLLVDTQPKPIFDNIPKPLSEKQNPAYLEPKEGVRFSTNKSGTTSYVYVNTFNEEYTDLHYWFFYTQAGSSSAFVRWLIDGTIKGYDGIVNLEPLGSMNGNWQSITIRVHNGTRIAENVYFPRQGNGTWIPMEKLEQRENRVVVYAARNSYSFYPTVGSHKEQRNLFDLYSSQLELTIRYETGKGRELDFSSSCQLISATYLGSDQPEEPLWLNQEQRWTNPNPDHLSVSVLKRILPGMFGTGLAFLMSRELADQLVNYFVHYFSDQYNLSSQLPHYKTIAGN